jgi:DNA gyrase/topoisomerase IV subunit A
VRDGQELLFISQNGMVQRNAVSGISRMGRATQGVRVMNLKKGDRVSAVALVVESSAQNGNGASAADGSVEDEAPIADSVAEEAAAAEAAGNGEARVTTAKPRRSSRSSAKPRTPSKRKSSPAKPKAGPKLKPKHTATAKQRAEADRKKKRN